MQQPLTLTQDLNRDDYKLKRFETTVPGGAKSISTIIPLNRFSFFEELEDKMLPPIQLQFDVRLQDDDELIHMANGADAGRVVVDRFSLFVPKITPKLPLYDKFISSFFRT